MKPTVSFSITTAENGWIIRRIDSHPEGAHGDYVFQDIAEACRFLADELDIIQTVRKHWEKNHA